MMNPKHGLALAALATTMTEKCSMRQLFSTFPMEKKENFDHHLGYPVVGPTTFLQRSLLLLKKETSR
jgi:hypothetical protein